MAAERLSNAELKGAIRQIINSAAFVANNSHLTSAELSRLRADPPQWPLPPVFTPFALTHHGYSQSMMEKHALDIPVAEF